MQTLESIIGEPNGSALRSAINRKIASPSLCDLNDPDRIRQLAQGNLRASYLFARFVVPSYASAIFSSFTKISPIDNSFGPLVINLLDMVKGELANNNIFNRPGECHAHYYDAKEAYIAANNGDKKEILEFDVLESSYGIEEAISQSSFWSPRSRRYAEAAIECCKNPYGAVVLMAVNEEMAPQTYRKALQTLSLHPKFDPLRTFMIEHTMLDSDNHGPAALQWLDHYTRVVQPDLSEKNIAENSVLKILTI